MGIEVLVLPKPKKVEFALGFDYNNRMKYLTQRLLETTDLTPIKILVRPIENDGSDKIFARRLLTKPKGISIRRSIQPRPRDSRQKTESAGIRITQRIKVPHLGSEQLKNLNTTRFKTITRHFDKKYLEQTLNGSFVFGTTQGYKASDTSQIGRFSDTREGTFRDVFRSRTGVFSGNFAGHRVENVKISGTDNPIVKEIVVNDFCSCSSLGIYDLDRANLIRNRGNPDIGAFAVYDFEKLLNALQATLAKSEEFKHFELLVRKVSYGEKDRHWEIEEDYDDEIDRDFVAIWLGATFVKTIDYQHEDEVRMLLIDRENAGSLPKNTQMLKLEGRRIAEAIVDSGTF